MDERKIKDPRDQAEPSERKSAQPGKTDTRLKNLAFAASWGALGGVCAWALLEQPAWAKLALGDGFLSSWGPEPLAAGFLMMAALGAWGTAACAGREIQKIAKNWKIRQFAAREDERESLGAQRR